MLLVEVKTFFYFYSDWLWPYCAYQEARFVLDCKHLEKMALVFYLIRYMMKAQSQLKLGIANNSVKKRRKYAEKNHRKIDIGS